MHSVSHVCKQVGDSNSCLPCLKLGRPCSWTSLPLLFGIDNWLEEVGMKHATKGDLHKAAAKALLNVPYAHGALKVLELEGHSGLITMGPDQPATVTPRWSQLSATDQQRFNTWNGLVEDNMRAMTKVKRSSEQWAEHMKDIQRLADQVSTADCTDMLRAYMKDKVEQEILYFIFNGRLRLRGG